MTLILVLPDDRAQKIRAKAELLALDEGQFIERVLVRICGEPHDYVPTLEIESVQVDEKESADYWLPKLYQNTFLHKGVKRKSAAWSVKMSFKGRRKSFSLGEDKRAAAGMAAQKYAEFKREEALTS